MTIICNVASQPSDLVETLPNCSMYVYIYVLTVVHPSACQSLHNFPVINTLNHENPWLLISTCWQGFRSLKVCLLGSDEGGCDGTEEGG